MFDLGKAEASAALDPAVILLAQRTLSAALEAPSGLDDAGRLDAVRALERLECVVTAAQAHLAAEHAEARREEHAALGLPRARRGQGVAHEIAWARRESPHRGQRHVGLAAIVGPELPATWEAWKRGYIGEQQATWIARETACLTRPDRLAVDALVAGDPEALAERGLRELVSQVQAEAARIDPASVVARRRRAEADRHVTLRPAPDTMTWLSALLPVKDGVAAYAALTRAADGARAAGDPRSRGAVMADALVGRVVAGQAAEADPTPVSLGLVMSDRDLFGSDDEPAFIEGFGPIPAELAREIVVGAVTAREQVWLRRLYSRPDTGELVAMEGRGRLFRGSLARFVRLRDQVCRTPWCDAPVRHLDHAVDHCRTGPTSGRNAQGLCEGCSYAKQAPGWRARPSPDTAGAAHEVETRLPTGHHYLSRPPRVVATVRRTTVRIDYALTG